MHFLGDAYRRLGVATQRLADGVLGCVARRLGELRLRAGVTAARGRRVPKSAARPACTNTA